MTDKPWFYFGCSTGCGAGHRLESSGGYVPPWARQLERFDGQLAPQGLPTLYLAALTKLGGWSYSALSWWDRSVDTRPGSNVIVFAPHLQITAEEIWTGFSLFFPREASRFVDNRSVAIMDGRGEAFISGRQN